MPTRMERYYKTETNDKQRSKRNASLYREIYDEAKYSNIEGIATIEKTNEIDIQKIKELLQKTDSYSNSRVEHRIVKPEPEVTIEPELANDKNYDIRDVLSKAKEEKSDENKYRSLNNTGYDILKNLNLKPRSNDEYESSDDELKELINTITSTSVINKMGDDELSLGLLSDLKSSGNTATISRNISNILKAPETEKEIEMDKSFFTSSLNFKENDFEELKDIEKSVKKGNKLITILLILLITVIIGCGVFLAYYFLFKK